MSRSTAGATVTDPALINGGRAEGRLWDIDTGRDLMITEPQRVADALLEIASA